MWANIGKACIDDAPTYDPSPVGLDSVRRLATLRRRDPLEERASIARKIPGGWGGVTGPVPGHGSRIFLTDTTKRTAALAALIAAGVYFSPNTEAIQGRWSYPQLFDWFRYIEAHLRGVHVSMWALDEWHNRLYFGVVDQAAAVELDRRLVSLNAPCFLVVREVIGEIHGAASESDAEP